MHPTKLLVAIVTVLAPLPLCDAAFASEAESGTEEETQQAVSPHSEKLQPGSTRPGFLFGGKLRYNPRCLRHLHYL